LIKKCAVFHFNYFLFSKNEKKIKFFVKMASEGPAGLLLLWIGCLIIGIYHLVIANANGGQFVGTLKSARVITETSCSHDKKGGNSCSNTYYVGETFYKNNSTHTCLIIRPTQYAFQGDAEAEANSKILGTKRKMWATWYSHGTCYDENIRYLNNAIGGSFFGFAMIFPVGFCCYLAYNHIRNKFKEQHFTLPYYNY
jgi:hypothetical protein